MISNAIYRGVLSTRRCKFTTLRAFSENAQKIDEVAAPQSATEPTLQAASSPSLSFSKDFKWEVVPKMEKIYRPTDEDTKKNPRKVKKVLDNRPIILEQRKRNEELNKAAEEAKLPWRTCAATFLTRYQIILPQPKQWEKDWMVVQERINYARRENLKNKLKGAPDAMITPQDEMTYEQILAMLPFQPAPITTDADQSKDRKSMNRRLEDSLVLVVKRNRSDFAWQLPQTKVRDGETLRETAERGLDRCYGYNQRHYFGDLPSGFYQYAYPKAIQEKRKEFGCRVFFYYAQWTAEEIDLNKKLYQDYAWIAKDEVNEYFDPETAKYMHHLFPF